MRTTLSLTLLAAMACMAGVAMAAPAPTAPPHPAGTAPPEIYHSISRPLCSALKTTIEPAIGMMIQNDKTIAKSPSMFSDYIGATAAGGDSQPRMDMDVMHLENLVTPLVKNTLAIHKMLDDTSIFPTTAQSADDKQLLQLKQKLLQSLASQEASLDIINGFVDTQQLSSMQHEGFGYISSITGGGPGDTQAAKNPQSQFLPAGQQAGPTIGSTPDPLGRPALFDNTALQAGLAPNPYSVDLATVPGLALGYNPVGNLRSGLLWTQDEAKKREAELTSSVLQAVNTCTPPQAPSPAPSPKP